MSRARIARWGLALAASLAVTATAPAAAEAAPVAGVNAHLTWSNVDAAELERQLAWVEDLGARTVRVDVGWPSLQETSRSEYTSWYVKKLDGLAAAVRGRGIKLIVTFGGSPCWASSAPDTLKQGCAGAWWERDVMRYAPSDPSAYAAALAYLVGRYGDVVAAWEVWNEPNRSQFFKTDDPARRYTDLVVPAYRAVKAVNPDATVLAGALSNADAAFAQKLFDHGLGRNFDGFSIHPYSGDFGPLTTPRGAAHFSFISGVPLVRDVLVRNGNSDRKMWLTEFGWSTADVREGEDWERAVDEATQATYLEQALAQVAKWDYVAGLNWYGLIDDSSNTSDTYGRMGLRRHDGSARPAYAAFKSSAAALHSGTAPTTTTTTTTTSSTTTTAPTSTGDAISGTTTDAQKGGKKARRLLVRLRRAGRRVKVEGRAPRNSRVRIVLRRGKARASIVSVRVGRTGRFSRRAPRAVRAGAWRVTASVVGTPARASSLVRVARRSGAGRERVYPSGP